MASTSILSKFLKPPPHIANALDWRKLTGSVLSMNVTQKKLSLALACHPEQDDKIKNLADIPLQLEKTRDNNRVVVKQEILEEIQDLCQRNKVCGIVVSWPVQKESGRMGHDCGTVLHTLDSLAEHSQTLTPARPFCLWDGRHVHCEKDDEWGRAARYGQNSCSDGKTVHVASQEQYNQAAHNDAAHVWADFCKNYWPEACVQRQPDSQEDDDDVRCSCLGEPHHHRLDQGDFLRATLTS